MIKSAFKFIAVGIIAVLCHYGVALALYKFFGVNHQLSNAIGFGSGFIFSYSAHAFYTYSSKPDYKNFIQYICLGAFNLCISSYGVHIMKDVLPFELSMLFIVTVIPAFNFFAGLIIFQKKGIKHDNRKSSSNCTCV